MRLKLTMLENGLFSIEHTEPLPLKIGVPVMVVSEETAETLRDQLAQLQTAAVVLYRDNVAMSEVADGLRAEVEALNAKLAEDPNFRSEQSVTYAALCCVQAERDNLRAEVEELKQIIDGNNFASYVMTLRARVAGLEAAIGSALRGNGGPIAAEDTVDGVPYVMVRESDFLALQTSINP